MRLLAPVLSAALVLALAGPALALAPSGRHDNIVYLNRLKTERAAKAEREARKAETERLAQARRRAADQPPADPKAAAGEAPSAGD